MLLVHVFATDCYDSSDVSDLAQAWGGGGDNLSTDLKNIKISDAMTPLSDPISEGKGILATFV